MYRALIALAVLASAIPLAPAAVRAQWVPDGVKLCPSGCGADAPQATADGQGGAFIAWRDGRFANNDIAIQRITQDGHVAPGWPAEGLSVCADPEAQHLNRIAPDGQGGVFVVWEDFRNALTLGTGLDVYLQRVTAAGELYPGWPLNGVPVCRARRHQSFLEVTADGLGGAFVTWDDERSDNNDIYAQRLLADGSIAPGWTEDGAPVCTLASGQSRPSLVADSQGGAFLFWNDTRNGPTDIYATRLLPDGTTAPGWTPQGDPIAVGPSLQRFTSAITDGVAGAYVAWVDYETDFGPSDIVALRITASGDPAPGWPIGGIPVAPAPDLQSQHSIAPDGFGGLLLAWTDYRNYATHGSDIYAQRLMPDGTLAPGWPAEGARVCERVPFDVVPAIAPDGLGGAYVAYEGLSGSTQIFVQHLSATGTRLWFPDGSLATSALGQFTPRIVTDEAHGAIVAWDGSGGSIWAQRFVADGPVPVQIAVASVETDPDRVVLLWQGPGAGGLEARVERRTEAADWLGLGLAIPEGADRLRFEDRSVSSGERYAYRLAYEDEGIERTSSETWVEVPRALELALEGFRPNPIVGTPVIAFTLPTAALARLEVLDIAGRRVLERDVGTLGPGRHTLRLSDGPRLAPGVYLIRLTSGGRPLHTRGVIVR